MPQIQDIRDMARDRSVASIARSLSVDEKTVRKYLKQDDFSPRPPEKTARKSRLDAHKDLIDRWLAEDERRWYKQRHTGRRIYERLRQESRAFDCSYVIVQRYVKQARGANGEHRANQELVWHPVRDEIHAQVMIAGRKSKNRNIEPHIRLLVLKECLRWLASKEDIRVLTVVVDKATKPDAETVFRIAWQTLIQRLENTLRKANFPGSRNSDDRGLLIPDNTNGELLTRIVRRMRRFNPISHDTRLYTGEGYRNIPVTRIVEDPFTKDSGDSLFLQMADVVVYFAQQLYKPNKFIRKAGARNFYKILDPVILKAATRNNPLGIVER